LTAVAFFVALAFAALLVLLVLFVVVAFAAPPEVAVGFAARRMLPSGAAHSGLAFIFCARMMKDTARMRSKLA
jgi:hypothetical protein